MFPKEYDPGVLGTYLPDCRALGMAKREAPPFDGVVVRARNQVGKSR